MASFLKGTSKDIYGNISEYSLHGRIDLSNSSIDNRLVNANSLAVANKFDEKTRSIVAGVWSSLYPVELATFERDKVVITPGNNNEYFNFYSKNLYDTWFNNNTNDIIKLLIANPTDAQKENYKTICDEIEQTLNKKFGINKWVIMTTKENNSCVPIINGTLNIEFEKVDKTIILFNKISFTDCNLWLKGNKFIFMLNPFFKTVRAKATARCDFESLDSSDTYGGGFILKGNVNIFGGIIMNLNFDIIDYGSIELKNYDQNTKSVITFGSIGFGFTPLITNQDIPYINYLMTYRDGNAYNVFQIHIALFNIVDNIQNLKIYNCNIGCEFIEGNLMLNNDGSTPQSTNLNKLTTEMTGVQPRKLILLNSVRKANGGEGEAPPHCSILVEPNVANKIMSLDTKIEFKNTNINGFFYHMTKAEFETNGFMKCSDIQEQSFEDYGIIIDYTDSNIYYTNSQITIDGLDSLNGLLVYEKLTKNVMVIDNTTFNLMDVNEIIKIHHHKTMIKNSEFNVGSKVHNTSDFDDKKPLIFLLIGRYPGSDSTISENYVYLYENKYEGLNEKVNNLSGLGIVHKFDAKDEKRSINNTYVYLNGAELVNTTKDQVTSQITNKTILIINEDFENEFRDFESQKTEIYLCDLSKETPTFTQQESNALFN